MTSPHTAETSIVPGETVVALDIDVFNPDLEELCRLYWQLDESHKFKFKVSELAEKFDLEQYAIPQIVKDSCVAYSTRFHCKTCNSPVTFSSRSSYQSRFPDPDWECNNCIEERRISIAEKKRKFIENILRDSKAEPIGTENIPFKEAAYLLALVRYAADEDLTYIQSLDSNYNDLLSPNRDFDLRIIESLYRAKIITISASSSPDAIELNDEGGFTPSLSKISWAVQTADEETLAMVIGRLEKKFSEMDYIDTEYDEVVALCKQICLQECLTFLKCVVEDHRLNFRVGEKTKMVLTSALENFSVAQVYNFIWRAGKDAAAFYLRSSVTRTHAANSIVGNIQKQAERALADKWKVKSFKRNFNIPQSVLSQVVFNLALGTNDGGFHMPIGKVV